MDPSAGAAHHQHRNLSGQRKARSSILFNPRQTVIRSAKSKTVHIGEIVEVLNPHTSVVSASSMEEERMADDRITLLVKNELTSNVMDFYHACGNIIESVV